MATIYRYYPVSWVDSVGNLVSELRQAAAPAPNPAVAQQWPTECGRDEAQTVADRDGPLVPLPAREPPGRVVPPFPLAAYQVLLRP